MTGGHPRENALEFVPATATQMVHFCPIVKIVNDPFWTILELGLDHFRGIAKMNLSSQRLSLEIFKDTQFECL